MTPRRKQYPPPVSLETAARKVATAITLPHQEEAAATRDLADARVDRAKAFVHDRLRLGLGIDIRNERNGIAEKYLFQRMAAVDLRRLRSIPRAAHPPKVPEEERLRKGTERSGGEKPGGAGVTRM